MKRVKLIDSIEHYRPDLLTALRHHRQRTCVGAKALLNTLDDVPDGIDAGRIDYWLSGDAKSAPKDHVLYVLNNWENLPTLQTVHITDNLFETLTDHRNRTGVGQCALLSGRKDIPEGKSVV